MIIDGKKLAEELNQQTKEAVAASSTGEKPTLAIILIGNNPESLKYIQNKEKKAAELGMQVNVSKFEETVHPTEVIVAIEKLNVENAVSGILVQLPVAKAFADSSKENITRTLLERITPSKDIDGLTYHSIAQYVSGDNGFLPATAQAIVHILDSIPFDVAGKSVVIVGRSLVVGKPTAMLMIQKNAAVTMVHSQIPDISRYTKHAEVIIMAAGKPKLLNSSMISNNPVVIDVGINFSDGLLIGDADFDEISEKCSYITPVPGGVGPLTVAFLMKNLLRAYQLQHAQV